MTRFAANTDVPVARTKMEIEALATKYGASQFMSFTKGDDTSIGFTIADRHVRFHLTLPSPSDKRFTQYRRGYNSHNRTPEQAVKQWEQACRSLWRALHLVVKAKLEAVEVGISTFEREFMANIVMSNGQLLHEQVTPRIAQMYETGADIPLLPGPKNA